MEVETAQAGIEAMSIQDKSSDKDSAEADLEKYNKAIESTSSPDAQLLASRASALYRLEKYRDAIKDCEDALEKDPKCLLALQICGKSFLALEDYIGAAAELQSAQQISHDESIEKDLSKIYKYFDDQNNVGKVWFDEKQEGGWQGPGERNTKNRAKKNKKIIKKATCGTKNEEEWLQQKWMSPEYIPNMINHEKISELGDDYSARKFRKYDQGFMERSAKLLNLCKTTSSSHTNQEKIKLVRKIEKAGDELHNDIIKVLKLLGIHDLAFIPGYLPSIILYKCLARFDCAKFIGSEPMVPCKMKTHPIAYELFQAAIKDADECIRILHFPEYMASLSPTEEGNPMAIAASQHSAQMNLMLFTRGRAYQYIEEYELAMNDFRALCSRKRMGSPDTWYQPPTLQNATMECLNTATLIKLRDRVPRPHYTKEELEKFEKEVGLGLYSAEKYFCGFCNAKKSNKVNLRLCSRCKNVWFCGQECLKKAWKAGHKAKCKPFTGHVFQIYPIPMEQIQEITKQVKETGLSCLESSDNCWMICKENGKYFDSLSNCELDFQEMNGTCVLRTYCSEG